MKLKPEELAGPRALGVPKMRARGLDTLAKYPFYLKKSRVRIINADWCKLRKESVVL